MQQTITAYNSIQENMLYKVNYQYKIDTHVQD